MRQVELCHEREYRLETRLNLTHQLAPAPSSCRDDCLSQLDMVDDHVKDAYQ